MNGLAGGPDESLSSPAPQAAKAQTLLALQVQSAWLPTAGEACPWDLAGWQCIEPSRILFSRAGGRKGWQISELCNLLMEGPVTTVAEAEFCVHMRQGFHLHDS